MKKQSPFLLEPEIAEMQQFQKLPNGIELDVHGRPIDALPIQEFYDALGRKLIAHFGEDFRLLLNASRMERGMEAL
jgi:hypothetical protein